MYTAKSFWMIIVFGFNMQSKYYLFQERIKNLTFFMAYSENVLRTLAHELHHFKVDKNELGFDIVELEEIAEQMRGMQDEMEQENEQDMQRAEMIL